MSAEIRYRIGGPLEVDEVIELYLASTLGERRPVDDRARMETMLREADVVVTAWDGESMVGIARSLTDYAYATYLSDLCVRVSHQKNGIGRELVRLTQEAAPQARVILLSAPAAVDYYPKIGMTKHESAWMLASNEKLK